MSFPSQPEILHTHQRCPVRCHLRSVTCLVLPEKTQKIHPLKTKLRKTVGKTFQTSTCFFCYFFHLPKKAVETIPKRHEKPQRFKLKTSKFGNLLKVHFGPANAASFRTDWYIFLGDNSAYMLHNQYFRILDISVSQSLHYHLG